MRAPRVGARCANRSGGSSLTPRTALRRVPALGDLGHDRKTDRARTSMTAPASKWVYLFGHGKADGTADMKDLLGGKGANLAEMANLGLPVPPGFTITTDVCTAYYKAG